MDTKALNRSVKVFWTTQGKAGQAGLALLDQAMLHWTTSGDWTALARFLALSGKEKASLWTIVRMSFGAANVKSTPDKKNEFGFRLDRTGAFEAHVKKNGIGVAGGVQCPPFPLAQQNGYGILREAIGNGKGFRSADFLKQVRETLGQDKPAKDKADKDTLEKLEHMFKYIVGKMKDDQDLKAELANLTAAFEKRIAARKAAIEPAH
jgi:hypothetical protein